MYQAARRLGTGLRQMSENTIPKSTWWVAAAAIIAAMVPHFFFTTPLELHMLGNMKEWLAIAIWAPAMLAGAGFFDAGEFSDSFDRPQWESLRRIALVMAPFVFMLIVGMQYKPLWTDMPRRPWDELAQAVPLYGGMWALTAVYWQGLVQHRLLADKSAALRIATIVVGHLVILAPFVLHTGLEVALTGYLLSSVVAALLAAGLFELGASVRAIMVVNGLMGMTYVFLQQAKLL